MQRTDMTESYEVLKSNYDITANVVSPIIGGWSALAYKVESKQGTFFLKVYDKKKSGTATVLKNIDFCMSVVSWLENNTQLNGRINAPLLTKQGNVRAETQDYACCLGILTVLRSEERRFQHGSKRSWLVL